MQQHREVKACAAGLLGFLKHAAANLTQRDYNDKANVWSGEEFRLLLAEKCRLTSDTVGVLQSYLEDVR